MAARTKTVTLTQLESARLRRFCAAHSDQDLVRTETELRGCSLTIVQRYRPWPGSRPDEWTRVPVARCTFSPVRGTWLLSFWSEEDRWELYCMDATPHLDALIMEIDVDPMGYFWG